MFTFTYICLLFKVFFANVNKCLTEKIMSKFTLDGFYFLSSNMIHYVDHNFVWYLTQYLIGGGGGGGIRENHVYLCVSIGRLNQYNLHFDNIRTHYWSETYFTISPPSARTSSFSKHIYVILLMQSCVIIWENSRY